MIEMDISDTADEEHCRKKVFKINHTVFDSLKVDCNDASTFVVIWNKYQIFVYENHSVESPSLILTPEFLTHQIIVTNNYLLCLDLDGNVHTISLKFKSTPQKRMKHNFLTHTQNLCCWAIYSEELIITLKIEDGTYLLSLHKTNSAFELTSRKIIRYEPKHWPLTEAKINNCLMKTCVISKSDSSYIGTIFSNTNLAPNPCTLVLISFDQYNVYGCIYDQDMSEESAMVKLYDCPTKISEIQIIRVKNNLNLLLGLTSGTIIKLPLTDQKKIELIHLNKAISKFVVFNESVIFTDGISLWRSDEIFSQNITFKQFFVQLVRDFVIVNDQVICITCNNQIYLFSINDNKVYLDLNNDEYIPAEKILNNSQCIHEIFKEIEKVNKLKEKLKEENNYALILSLANRQDVMDTVLHNKVIVYEEFDEAINDNDTIILTNKSEEYYEPNTFLVFIQITTTDSHNKISDVLLTSKCDLTLHIRFSSTIPMCTTSVKIEQLQQINVLVPIHVKDTDGAQLNVDLKVVSNIPGSLDRKQTIWAVLYRKQVVLNSVNFIRTNVITNKNITSKEPKDSINDLILKTATNFHGDLFNFADGLKSKNETSHYVKLPYNYKEVLTNEHYFKSTFSTRKADYLIKQLSSIQFLEFKHCITFEICQEKVKIGLVNDFSTPQLIVTSENPKLSFNIRNFFGELFYRNVELINTELGFVPFAIHATADSGLLLTSMAELYGRQLKLSIYQNLLCRILQKNFSRITNESQSEEILELIEQFNKNIFGALPL